MTRKYEQRVRAEKQDETRRRIVEAAVDLHGTLGPAATTLSAVAERAGVQRNTLYRHFPDERSLLTACSGHFFELHPIPDPGDWVEISDPGERTRRGLRELYDYYAATEQMTANVLRDGEVSELVREINTMRAAEPMARLAESLVAAWPHPTPSLAAAVDLAVAFPTWRSLVRESGQSNEVAVELMARMLAAAAA